MTMGLYFQFPYALVLLPLVAWLFYKSLKNVNHGYVLSPFANNQSVYSTWRTRLRQLPDYLKILSLGLAIIALARPQKPLVNQNIEGKGIDIMLALDISKSMLEEDFSPNRIEVSKKLAIQFVNKRTADKIGLVVFSGEAFTQCPLTIDHQNLNYFILNQEVGYLQDGTAIGTGLATAVNRLKDSKSKSKIIVLLTDGENNAGEISIDNAISLAKDLGVKVYAIGLGNENSGLSFLNLFRSPLDVATLNKIATTTGGKFYRAQNEKELNEIYNEIDRLEKYKFDVNVVKKYKEMYRPFLAWGTFFFALSIVLSSTILKRFP